MKNTTKLRELMLDLYDLETNSNAFSYAKKMIQALKDDEITYSQYDLLAGSLYIHCQREKIETSNEICSLF